MTLTSQANMSDGVGVTHPTTSWMLATLPPATPAWGARTHHGPRHTVHFTWLPHLDIVNSTLPLHLTMSTEEMDRLHALKLPQLRARAKEVRAQLVSAH
jgi:hypothetical protein